MLQTVGPYRAQIRFKKISYPELTLLQVDLGEAEAIVLAKSLNADWLLIDETKGRNIAKMQGLHIIGLLGVILQAKSKGYIPNVKDLLNTFVSKAKFRVSDELREKFLELSGE